VNYCIYLRKSRADLEAEANGDLETLARHEKILLDLARRQNLNITAIYKEIVSGETIAARPVMQQLLQEVEQNKWDGVLAVELERLARGDTIDQGLVAQAFKFSNTLIITPTKTFNPNNEFDEEYFEFGLFMSRREYKTINRRLQQGRLASVTEGNFIATFAPFGYNKIQLPNKNGFTLELNENAEYVKLIFDLYINERMGSSAIATLLNNQGVKPPKATKWVGVSIRDILSNPVYYGKIRWNWRATKTQIVNGQKVKKRPREYDNALIFEGKHEAIISEETFKQAEQIRKSIAITHEAPDKQLKNPFAGLVKCGVCGRTLARRPNKSGSKILLLCPTVGCPTVASEIDDVEKEVLVALDIWLKNYKVGKKTSFEKSVQSKQTQINAIEKAIVKANNQKDSLYDFLEQGIYSTKVFLERSEKLNLALEQYQKQLNELKESPQKTGQYILAPKIEMVLNEYFNGDATSKNELLKSIINKIIYTKEVSARWKESHFSINIQYKF